MGLQIPSARPLLQIRNLPAIASGFCTYAHLDEQCSPHSRKHENHPSRDGFLLDVGAKGFEPLTPWV